MDTAPTGLDVTVEVTVTMSAKPKRLVREIEDEEDAAWLIGFGLAGLAAILKSGTRTEMRGNWLNPTPATAPVALILTT